MTVKDNLIYGGIALGSIVFLGWVIPAYTPPHPGYGVAPSLLPNVTVGIILAISLMSLAHNGLSYLATKAQRQAEIPPGGKQSSDGVHLWHLARFIIPCVLLMPAMTWVGFIPAGLVFMLIIQYLCGQRKILPAVIVALGTVFLAYWVMRYGLGAPLP